MSINHFFLSKTINGKLKFLAGTLGNVHDAIMARPFSKTSGFGAL